MNIFQLKVKSPSSAPSPPSFALRAILKRETDQKEEIKKKHQIISNCTHVHLLICLTFVWRPSGCIQRCQRPPAGRTGGVWTVTTRSFSRGHSIRRTKMSTCSIPVDEVFKYIFRLKVQTQDYGNMSTIMTALTCWQEEFMFNMFNISV